MNYTQLETLEAVKEAVLAGKRVLYKGEGYELRRSANGNWDIVCLWNKHLSSLYWLDGVRTDYKASDFLVAE